MLPSSAHGARLSGTNTTGAESNRVKAEQVLSALVVAATVTFLVLSVGLRFF